MVNPIGDSLLFNCSVLFSFCPGVRETFDFRQRFEEMFTKAFWGKEKGP